MATKLKRGSSTGCKQTVQPNVLGNTRLPPNVRDVLVHPDGTPLREIPKDESVEVALSKVENLLGKGHYGAALREIGAVKIGDTPLAGAYAFILQDKTARAQLGIADRYFIRGDGANARKFYQQAIEVATTDPAVKGIAETAGPFSFWLSAVHGPGSAGVSPASGAGQRPALPGKPRRFLAPTGELNGPAKTK